MRGKFFGLKAIWTYTKDTLQIQIAYFRKAKNNSVP